MLSPILFTFCFTFVLTHAVRDLDHGVCLGYRLDGVLFDFRCLNAKTKMLEGMILEALFANDCALMAQKSLTSKFIMDKFLKASYLFSLTIILRRLQYCYSLFLDPLSIHLQFLLRVQY